jgi:uncharacterized phiE125 gp8 family phage protein
MRVEVVTPPGTEPLSVADAKLYCRVDHAAEDALFTSLAKAARQHLERLTGRALAEQTLQVTLPGFPRCKELPIPRPPLVSVTSVTYLDADGDAVVLVEDTDYAVNTESLPGALYAESGWPSTIRGRSDAVRIVYVAGHGAAGAEALPENALVALRYLVSHWYTNRDTINLRFASDATIIPFTVKALASTLQVPFRLPEYRADYYSPLAGGHANY